MERNEEKNTELSLESIIAEVKCTPDGETPPDSAREKREPAGTIPAPAEADDLTVPFVPRRRARTDDTAGRADPGATNRPGGRTACIGEEAGDPAPGKETEAAEQPARRRPSRPAGRGLKTEVFQAPSSEIAGEAAEGEGHPGKNQEPAPRQAASRPYDCIRYQREDPADTVSYLRKKIRSTTPRIILLAPLCLAALYLMATEVYPIPLAGRLTAQLREGAVCGCLLLAMLLSWEVQWSGLRRLVCLHPTLDSLVFFQCGAMLAYGVLEVLQLTPASGCFGALGVVSCLFSMIQKRSRMIAVRRSHKAAMMGAMPAGVKVCSDCAGNLVAVKTHEGAEPDFSQMCRMDRTEEASLWFAPLLLLFMVILSGVTAYLKQSWAQLPYYLAAMSAVSAPPALLLSSAQAAKKVGKQLFGSGSVLLSNHHAKQMAKANFAILCDADLYPVGTMKISGMKVMPGFSVETVVSYTAGVMIFLGGGVGKAFSDFTREQYLVPARVQQQKFFESGGISAQIEGHTVLVGPALFLNRFGIAVTAGKKVRRGVFVAVDGTFAGLFSVNTVPQSQVYHAFTLLRQARIRPVLDVLNFLTDQEAIEEEFELRNDSTDYPDLNERIYGSECEFGVDEPPMALLARDGMLPFAEVLLGAKRQTKATGFCLTLGLLSAGLGIAVMYFLLYSGAAAATPLNALLYSALWSLPAWVFTAANARI